MNISQFHTNLHIKQSYMYTYTDVFLFISTHLCRLLQTNSADPDAADRAERDGRRGEVAAAPGAPCRQDRQGGARLLLPHALQRQRGSAGTHTPLTKIRRSTYKFLPAL